MSFSRCGGFVALVVCVALFVLPLSSQAQGTSGTVPDPISTGELLAFGKRLSLSPQQQTAVQALHDVYKTSFRELREGPIAELLKGMRAMQGGGGGGGMMPDRASVKKFLDRSDEVNRRINEVDNRLFDEMTALLTPEQQAMMPRVRQARQRDRYGAQQMMWMASGPPVDLSEAFADLTLTAEEDASADAVLAPYESRLTADCATMYEASSRMILDMYDAMAKAGLDETSFQDPEKAEAASQQMQVIWQEMSEKSQATARDLRDRNHRTLRGLAAVLPPAPARELRHWYHGRVYPESGVSSAQADSMFTHALKLETLGEPERQAVIAARSEFHAKINQVMEDAAALIDKFRNNQGAFDFDQEGWEEHQQQLSKIQERGHEVSQAAIHALNATIGEERAARILLAADGADQPKPDAAAAIDVHQSDDEQFNAELANDPDEPIQWGADQFLPPRIGARELTECMAMLKLSDEQRTIVQQMHKEYQEQWRTLEAAGPMVALQKQIQSHWQDADGERATGPTSAQLDESYRLRQTALEAIIQHDKGFFDDLELAVLTADQLPSLARVRRARERVTYNRGDVISWMSDGVQEGVIDMARLAHRQRWPEAHRKAADPALAEYESKAVELMKTRYDASLTYMRAQEQWNVEAPAIQKGGGQDFTARYRALLEAPLRAVAEADGKVRELNRATLEQLVQALPSSEAFALRRDYNKRAFPQIYHDPTALETQLDEALRLDDLADEQRRKVTDLIAEYRPGYDALCDQMVQQSSTQPDVNRAFGWEGGEWQKVQERQEVVEKMRFDRSELNQRAIATLHATLSEHQIQRIGGLPAASDDERHGMWD